MHSQSPKTPCTACLWMSTQDQWQYREERSSSTEGQIRLLVYTLEIASQRADASGELLCCKGLS